MVEVSACDTANECKRLRSGAEGCPVFHLRPVDASNDCAREQRRQALLAHPVRRAIKPLHLLNKYMLATRTKQRRIST